MFGEFVENPIERNFSFRVAPLAGCDPEFDPGDGALADEHDLVLFNREVQEIVAHDADDNVQLWFWQ